MVNKCIEFFDLPEVPLIKIYKEINYLTNIGIYVVCINNQINLS